MAVIKGGFEIVKRAMLKELMKRGDDGIMLTLPKNELVDLNARITMDRLIKAGINPESLTSPDQVLNVLENINNQMMKNARVISADSAEGKTITDKLFGKKGEVVEFPQKRTFKEEIEAMKKSGDIVDKDDMVISEKITDREMFKNSNLNKRDSVTETISYIKTLEPMDAMKEANSVIGRKGKYKNLTPEESKKILQDTEDHIFERDIPIDPEDMAKGGRAGYQTGNQVMPAVDARMQNTYEQNTKLNQIQRNINERVRKGSKTQGLEIGQLGEMYGKKPTEYNMNYPNLKRNEANLYGAATNMGLRPEQIKAVAYFNTLQKNYGDMGMMGAPLAGPGGVGPMGGGLASFTGVAPGTSPFAMEKFFKTPAEQFAHYQEGLRRSMMLNPNSGIYFDADKTYDAGDYISPKGIYTFNDPDPNERRGMMVDGKEYFSEQDAIDDMGIERYNQFMASGGRAGLYTGGMVDVEPNLSDIGHGSDALMARTRLVSPDGQATTSTGLNYLLAEDNDNIRVPFSKGKLADAARRKFMKAAGAGAAGLAALKTGLVGLGEKAAPVVEKVAETAQGVPPYFYQLIDVIKSKGQEIKSYGDRIKQYIAPSKDGKSELMLTEDLNTGDIQVKKIYKEGDDMVTKTEEMNFNKGRVDEATKVTPVDNYEEVTSYNSRIYKDEFNDPDFVDGIDVEEIVKEIDVKKADGGRIGFSKGKLATNAVKFLEKIFGKENMAEMPNRDPEMYQGMLEVVDMFRNRDKEGLKMYMQKFLPHMDDTEIEEFIIGDAVDSAGQAKFGLGDMSGQLIRLGSGRDYAAKIKMIKEAENAKKLENLDVKDRKPNALGGIQTMLGE